MTVKASWANDIVAAPTTLVSTHCADCGLVFGLDERFMRHRRKDHRDFYCPNGHSLVYKADLLDEANTRLELLEAMLTHERDQRLAAERSRTAYKAQVTKIRRRVAKGICPACHRSFANVARHMEGQHPDFAEDTP